MQEFLKNHRHKLFVLIACAAFFSTLYYSARAATPITKEMATAYFKNCVLKDGGIISASSQKKLCACTSARMVDAFTLEDMRDMGGNDQKARDAINKMIVNVYAPCIKAPAQDYYRSVCMNNPDTKKLTSNTEPLCSCMAYEVASFLEKNSAALFQDILARNPNVTDPMQALTSDPQFENFAQKKLLACYTNKK